MKFIENFIDAEFCITFYRRYNKNECIYMYMNRNFHRNSPYLIKTEFEMRLQTSRVFCSLLFESN